MRVAIYGRQESAKNTKQLVEILHFLKENGIETELHSDLLPYQNSHSGGVFGSYQDLNPVDVMISIGGDGTLLDTLTLIRDREIPVLGVNTGRLGFLANVNTDRLHQALNAMINGQLKQESRMLIRASSEGLDFNGFDCALNEATLHKNDTSSMISIKVNVDNTFMNNYWADGLIVCTPTGSTAYSLSCGGPIVMPTSDNFSITPIAPHNLNVRPMVLSSNCSITIKAEGREDQFLFTLDSRSFTVDAGREIKLEKAPYAMRLLNFEDQDFFSTIRKKMMWGIDKRN